MLDFSKSRYSEEWVTNEIKKVQQALNIKHMPSRREIEIVTNNTTLTNLVVRSGGFRHWADKLNLKIKGSETEFGYQYEKEAQKYLTDVMGHKAELTPVKFPYDIIVDDVTKIDVKVSNKYHSPDGTSWYTFNLETVFPKCDFFIAYCIDNHIVNNVYVIPAHIMLGKRQLSMGDDTMYKKYAKRWDLIEKHIEAMKKCFA
jgi:hypothetical protein